jgi:antitoxin (DNA-binding transcriptional repressor) of toxin-antitoxin stability system
MVQAEQGHDVVIARRGKPSVRLEPIHASTRRTLGFIPGTVSGEVLNPLTDDDLGQWG